MFGLFKSTYQKYTDSICKNAGHKDLHSLLTELYNDEFAWDQAMYGANKFVESTNMWEAIGEDKTNAKRCLRDPDGQVEALRKIFADKSNYSFIELKGKNLPHSFINKSSLKSIA